jgi:hypothetical protein
MPLQGERVVDGCVRLKKTLRWTSRIEAQHLSLASSNGGMRVLGALFVAQSA